MIPILQRATTASTKASRSRMRWVRLLALLLLIVTLIVAAAQKIHQLTTANAAGGDWSTYLHDLQRTSASGDTTLTSANAAQLTVNWSFKTGGPIAASPTIVGGTVYVGSWDGYEYALDAATGTLKWKTFLGQTTAPCYPQLAGVSSAADVENGVVYVGGGDSNWYALDAATGNVLWKVFIGDNTKGWYNWASPLIYNGFAYIGTSSAGDCPLVPGQLLKVDLTTHQIVNTFNFVPQGQYGGGIWTSPSLDTATNTIFVTTGTRNQPSQTLSEAVVALDASTLALKSSWAVPASQETVDSDFASTPILFNDAAGDQLMAAVNKNGIAYVYNRNNLSAGPVWTQQIDIGGSCPQCGDGSASSGAFGNGTLFLGGGNSVINGQGYKGSVNALDPATGKFLWQHGTPGAVVPALAYTNSLVIDGAGPVLEVLDASSGTRLYSYTTGGALYAAPSVANGQIFTGGTDDNVYAFGLPATTPPPPPPDPNCPSGWSCQDIGNPTPAGSETVSGNTWSVNAGGAGSGGTADQFRFTARKVSGDSQVSAKVVSQQTTGGSAQAGLMVRQSSDPASPYYAIFLQPNNRLVVQYRQAFGGATTTVTQTNPASLPLYLEIQRVGDQSLSGGTWTLKGAGNDINGNADQFHYVRQSLAANGSISAHILTQTNTNASAKAGVMLRQGTNADSAYYAAFVTPGNGIVVQYRPTQGLKTQIVSGPTGTAPTYLMIARSSNIYCTYTSSDGANWSYVTGTCFTLSLNSPTLAGLAVTSQSTGTMSTATFDTVNFSTTAPPPPTICTGGWSCGDIGYPFPAGSQSLSGRTWTIQGGGNDIWGTADQFHFVSQALAANGSVSARAVSQTNTTGWAKAGVMLRQSADPGSAYYAALVTPGNGIVVQYRTAQGGNAQQSASLMGTEPAYLMVTRSGNTYTAYTSTNGTTWTVVSGSSITLNTSGSVLAGLALTSHDASALSTVTFDTGSASTHVP